MPRWVTVLYHVYVAAPKSEWQCYNRFGVVQTRTHMHTLVHTHACVHTQAQISISSSFLAALRQHCKLIFQLSTMFIELLSLCHADKDLIVLLPCLSLNDRSLLQNPSIHKTSSSSLCCLEARHDFLILDTKDFPFKIAYFWLHFRYLVTVCRHVALRHD